MVGLDHVVLVEADAEELAGGGVHGGFEELFGVHFAETLEAFDLNALAGDFEHAGEDFGDRKQRRGLLFFAFAFDEIEEWGVVRVEVADVDAGFGEAGKEFGDRVRLVEFVEYRTA